MTMEATTGGVRGNANMGTGAVWMIGITLVLFFLPLINGIVGGIVGGYKVGDWKRALGAAVLPALVVALGMGLIVAAFGAPIVGFVGGTAAGIVVLLADLGIFIGAAIGGLAAQSRKRTAPGHA
jgi:hypothetical protein